MIKSALLAIALMLGTSSFADDIHLTKKKHYQTKQYKHKHRKGLKHDEASKKKMRAFKHTSFLNELVPIPGHMDYSSMLEVRNQGACGSCWAHSLTEALQLQSVLSGRAPGVLEVNYLLDNCGPGPKMWQCQGGSFAAASSFEFGHGPGLESLNPYRGVPLRCKHLPVKATALDYSMLGTGSSSPTFKDIAYAIGVQKHVLSADVAAGMGDFESYQSGIYDDCQGNERNIDHMILIVSYSCESSVDAQGNCVFDKDGKPIHGDGYLGIRNSWGADWGENGNIRMRMYGEDGKHCNGIASHALFFNL